MLTQNIRLNTSSAHLLVFHGSRDRQYWTTISELGSLVTQQLCLIAPTFTLEGGRLREDSRSKSLKLATAEKSATGNVPLVAVAALEFADVELSEKMVRFAQIAIANKYQRLTIVPVFLSAGVHVKEDIPQAIAQARQQLGDRIKLELLDYIGNASLTALITQKFALVATDNRILLAHGSRLPQGNLKSEQLARRVKAKIAYWAVQPNLTSVVELLAHNKSPIAIVPYFLFSGKITEAIASQVAQLQDRFPNTQLHLARPLGATPELAKVIVNHITACNG